MAMCPTLGRGTGGGNSGGSGGGGSSFATAAATDVSSGANSRTGDGQVTISFDPATDSCPTPASTPAVVATPRFTGERGTRPTIRVTNDTTKAAVATVVLVARLLA